jgi:hypothetical protein
MALHQQQKHTAAAAALILPPPLTFAIGPPIFVDPSYTYSPSTKAMGAAKNPVPL